MGSGHGQHLQFVNSNFKKYYETDIDTSHLPIRQKKVIQLRVDAHDLSQFKSNYFDRIVVSCLIMHLNNPEIALQEWLRVVKNQGTISIYVPCEPGLLLRLARKFSTSRAISKQGINSYSVHYREHINYYLQIRHLIQEIFDTAKISRNRFPIPYVSWNFALYDIFHIQVSK